MKKPLQVFETFDLWQPEQSDLAEFTKFVLRIYYEHHLHTPAPIDEVNACIKEDLALFPNGHFYTLKTKEGEIFGTIGVSLWDGKAKLAIEQEYDLDITHEIKTRGLNPPQVWNIRRFATDRQMIKQRSELRPFHALYFKLLLTCVFHHICAYPNNAMVAECDCKLQRTLISLGISSEELSKPHFVLGSQAVPIFNTGAGLQEFYDNHKHLLNHV